MENLNEDIYIKYAAIHSPLTEDEIRYILIYTTKPRLFAKVTINEITSVAIVLSIFGIRVEEIIEYLRILCFKKHSENANNLEDLISNCYINPLRFLNLINITKSNLELFRFHKNNLK